MIVMAIADLGHDESSLRITKIGTKVFDGFVIFLDFIFWF